MLNSCIVLNKYYMYKKNIFFLLSLFATLGAYTQGNLQTYHKYEKNQLLIRWSPGSGDAWAAALEKGYILKKYENGALVYQSETPILPIYTKTYSPTYGDEDRFLFDRLVNLDKADPAEVEESYPARDFTPSQRNEARLTTVNFLISSDFNYILDMGLGFLDTKITPGKNYRYTIESADPALAENTGLKGQFDFSPKTYTPPVPPDLTATWDNRRVDLKWNTLRYKNNFYAYSLEKSDDGRIFIPMDSTVIINPYDTSAVKEFHDLIIADYFDNNTDLHYYRLYSHDYLGGRSQKYSEVVGKGKIRIGLSPAIEDIKQIPGNKAHIKWSILEQFEHLVHHWDVFVAEEWEGPYVRDTSNLKTSTREIKRPIRYGSTYFRIEAVDQEGRSYSSFPQMMMAMDTTAPARPIEVTYTADTTGIITLNWKKNYEKDFLGYKVFASYDTSVQYVLRHERFLSGPTFRDSIGLKTEKKYIYYQIIAVDERNNRSPYSDRITIPIPDILPPEEPQFTVIQPGKGRIYLNWAPSSSEDVVSQSLFRRNTDKEQAWTLLREWSKSDLAVSYIDSTVSGFDNFAYLLSVKDASGLTSPPSQPVILSPYPDHRKFGVDQFKVRWIADEKDKQKKQKFVAVSFQFPWNDLFEVILYKQKDNEQPSVLRSFETPTKEYIDKNIEKGHTYTYFIRVTFNDGDQSNYSTHLQPQ